MKSALAAVSLLIFTACRAVAVCPGDLDNNGETTVDEIVQAVNAALNGCATPTPRITPTASATPVPSFTAGPGPTFTPTDRCVLTFERGGTGQCVYKGTLYFEHPTGARLPCLGDQVMSFRSNGTTTTFVLGTPGNGEVVYLRGSYFDSEFTVMDVATNLNFSDAMPVNGIFYIQPASHRLYVQFNTGGGFAYKGCNVVGFIGDYLRAQP